MNRVMAEEKEELAQSDTSSQGGSPKRFLFGIAERLYLALAALAAMIVIASALAWLAFAKIDKSVVGVTADAVPRMVQALSLATVSAEIAAIAPGMEASRSNEERVRQKALMDERHQRLVGTVDQLARSGVDSRRISELSSLEAQLKAKLTDLDREAEHRIDVGGEKESALADLAAALTQFENVLEPFVDDSIFNLVMRGESVSSEQTEMINELVEGGISTVDRLLAIKAEGNLAAGLLTEALHTDNTALVGPLREQFDSAALSIDGNLRLIRGLPQASALKRASDALLFYGRQGGVFDSGPGGSLREVDDGLKAAHEAFLGVLAPMADDAAFDLVMDTEKLTQNGAQSISELIDLGTTELYLLLSAQAEGNLAASLLNQSANVPDENLLGPLEERFTAASYHVNDATRQLGDPEVAGRVKSVADALLSHGAGENGLFRLRRQELEHELHAGIATRAAQELTSRLGTHVAEMVAESRRDSNLAAAQALTTIENGKLSLLAVSVTGIAVAIFVMMFYVRWRVIRPIKNMTSAMTQLAEGDTGVDIPYREQKDEMGSMARALGVFRDTAVEVQRSSLREIETARRRLSDAIESISEAFSLYDADDRLIICNGKYQTLLYPSIADEIRPGMSFEQIVRRAVEAGYIEDAAEDNADRWIAERLEKHRNPGDPHIQKRKDGSWIMVSERKTAEGGTVAVYSDITELKQREEELTSKSAALEQLSSQLAKYLAPQVYESIFSGGQEVTVASRRRKLTVFFSDIADFTETADRLESEDLTALLNHYLTEMAKIAMDHGATIDKFVGDGIVIFFGDPESLGTKEDALACVSMAVAMRQRMAELEAVWRDAGIEKPLQCRMGINTGFCTVGNFGSEFRLDYTIIGGGVNLASRLERAAEPGEILISYETYALIKDAFGCQEKGKIAVRGLAYPVATYSVTAPLSEGGAGSARVSESHPNLRLHIDPDAMSVSEKREMSEILRRAMASLQDED
jgi:adenylate cyclase